MQNFFDALKACYVNIEKYMHEKSLSFIGLSPDEKQTKRKNFGILYYVLVGKYGKGNRKGR